MLPTQLTGKRQAVSYIAKDGEGVEATTHPAGVTDDI